MERLKSGMKNALFYLVVGPAIGVLIYGTGAAALSGDLDGSAVLGVLWLLPFGYILGGLPAAVTGFLIGLVTRPKRPLFYLATSGVLGTVAAALVALVDSTEPSSMDGVVNLALLGALASVGTSGGRLLFNRLRQARTRAAGSVV